MTYQHDIFSTPIWGFVLNDEANRRQSYIDFILDLERREINEKKSNIGGYQTRDNLQKEPVFKELVMQMTKLANDTMKKHKVHSLVCKSMWANVNRYKDMNINHIHEGVVSGVFYVNIPYDSGRLMFCNPAVRSELCSFTEKMFPVVPMNCAFIMFPSWLEHFVEPNLNPDNQPRICLGVNFIKLEDNDD